MSVDKLTFHAPPQTPSHVSEPKQEAVSGQKASDAETRERKQELWKRFGELQKRFDQLVDELTYGPRDERGRRQGPSPYKIDTGLYDEPVLPGFVWEALTEYAAFLMRVPAFKTDDLAAFVKSSKGADDRVDLNDYTYNNAKGSHFNGFRIGDQLFAFEVDETFMPRSAVITLSLPNGARNLGRAAYPDHMGNDVANAVQYKINSQPNTVSFPTPDEEATYVANLRKKLKESLEKPARIGGDEIKALKAEIKEIDRIALIKETIEAADIPERTEELVLSDAAAANQECLRTNDEYKHGTEFIRDLEEWAVDVQKKTTEGGNPLDFGMNTASLETTKTRRSEVAECMTLAKTGPVLARSTFRAGTSTLLRSLESTPAYQGQTILIDGPDPLPFSDVERLIATLDPRSVKKDMSIVEAFQTWDRLLGEKGQRGFFASTEAAVLGKFDSDAGRRYLDLLATLKNVDVIIHRQYSADQTHLTGEVFRGFKEYAVPPLSLADTVQALHETLGNLNITFRSSEAQNMTLMIYQFTGGKPIELSAVMAQISKQKKSPFTAQDLEQIINSMPQGVNKILSGESDGIDEDSTEKYLVTWLYQRMTQYLDGDDMRALKRLALDQDVKEDPAIDRLLKLGFVTRDQKTNRYTVNGTLTKTVLPTLLAEISI